MAMFVQAFWFGAKLVREGKISPGDVMAVFWACLIATSNLQMCVPQFIVLARGKFAMVSLVMLIEPPPPAPASTSATATATSNGFAASHLTLTPLTTPALKSSSKKSYPHPLSHHTHHSHSLRKITPSRCTGEFSLHAVSFSYPSRPTQPILSNISLYLPANETTFIVGGSGSGKSTVAQLLVGLYAAGSGCVCLDDQDVRYLDENWVRRNVALVSQSCILFDKTVHENVAMGLAGSSSSSSSWPYPRTPEAVTREEVIEACTAALMHEFIRDLPDGYDTKLGTGGASLSGGQKQRLAIARAKIRDPCVLVLDEATSALDPTSRVLVFEAIKSFRKNKTTIVITHDLSQITPSDFVYVLKSGEVVEQGYRYDLESLPDINGEEGEFRRMMRTQGETGGFLPVKGDDEVDAAVEASYQDVEKILEEQHQADKDEIDNYTGENRNGTTKRAKHESGVALIQPVALGNWMFDVVADLTGRANAGTPMPQVESRHASGFVDAEAFRNTTTTRYHLKRRASVDLSLAFPTSVHAHDSHDNYHFDSDPSHRQSKSLKRHMSLQFTPTSPTFSTHHRPESTWTIVDDEEFEEAKKAMERSGDEANKKRFAAPGPGFGQRRRRVRWDGVEIGEIVVDKTSKADAQGTESKDTEQTSFLQLVRDVYPTVPHKPLVFFGVIVCLLSGAMTPLFSFLLSRLLFEVSTGAKDVGTINKYGGIVLSLAAADGLLIGLKFFIMETTAISWVTSIRKKCYAIILAQDKKWFDKRENSPLNMVQILIKDGDDARNLIAIVLGQFAVVFAMLGVGLVWALVAGWQLTLAGFAIAPVFGITMAVQANLVAKCELKNKRAREEVAKGYYEAISNVRAIRAMSFESVFQQQFKRSVAEAHRTGIQGAFVEGCTYGVASALIYLAEALLFYVGAVLVARGTYTYLQMVEVLNLVVFSVSIGSQLMSFTQRIAKSTQATRDFNRVLKLSTNTEESRGILQSSISGDIEFHDVCFSYPERADVPVLQNTSLRIGENECVAVVGSSGSGKSTVASLLQRLYKPNSGYVTIGNSLLGSIDVKHLREHVAVVSQNPNLFDATIAANISYGNSSMSMADIHRAAKAAHVHDFIMSLPQGYDTMVGENASLISGGQAQRLQIARALARPSKILILDECTSALDPANQAAVMDTIRTARIGRTTLMVTHKVPVMQMCDRIVVLHAGAVAEEGTYDELMQRNGIFYQLATGGEWTGE